MNKSVMTVMLGCTLLVSTASYAVQPASNEKQAASAVEFRQALLQLVRSNVGALGAMAKGNIPMDTQTIEKNASRIEQLSLMMDDYFNLDTSEFKLDTEALPKIWSNYPDFQMKILALTDASVALKNAAKQNQTDQYQSKIGAVLKSCKGCHDEYKAD